MNHQYGILKFLRDYAGDLLRELWRWFWRLPWGVRLGVVLAILAVGWWWWGKPLPKSFTQPAAAARPALTPSHGAVGATTPTVVAPLLPTPTIPSEFHAEQPLLHAWGQQGRVELTVYLQADGSYWWRLLEPAGAGNGCRKSAGCRAYLVVQKPFGTTQDLILILNLQKTSPYTAVSQVLGYIPPPKQQIELRVVEGAGSYQGLVNPAERKYFLTATY